MNFLAIDCGLTNIKAIVFDEKGNEIAKSSQKTPLTDKKIDTKLLWNYVCQCTLGLTEKVKNIDSVSVSAHGNGVYLFDKGTPLRFGYSSMFEGELSGDGTLIDKTLQTEWKGQPLNIVKRIRKENVSFDKICFCKDFIGFMLTGELCTDITDASAGGIINNNTLSVDASVLNAFGENDLSIIPEIKAPYDIRGKITKDAGKQTGIKEGTPVVVGAFDVISCLMGAGVDGERELGLISGTWGINAVLTREKTVRKNITQCTSFGLDGLMVAIDSAPTSSVNLEWTLNNLLPDVNYDEVDKLSYDAVTDIIYMPYIFAPMRDPKKTGAFLGISSSHKKEDFIKAVLSGICFEHRFQTERLKDAGLTWESATLTGGITNSYGRCQLMADVLETKVKIKKEKESGALGGAILSALALNVYPDLKTATLNMVKEEKIFYPQKSYKLQYEKFCKLQEINL